MMRHFIAKRQKKLKTKIAKSQRLVKVSTKGNNSWQIRILLLEHQKLTLIYLVL